MATNMGQFRSWSNLAKNHTNVTSGRKESEKYILLISDLWFSSYDLKGQRSETYVNFGHMGSNIKNCQICKIF